MKLLALIYCVTACQLREVFKFIYRLWVYGGFSSFLSYCKLYNLLQALPVFKCDKSRIFLRVPLLGELHKLLDFGSLDVIFYIKNHICASIREGLGQPLFFPNKFNFTFHKLSINNSQQNYKIFIQQMVLNQFIRKIFCWFNNFSKYAKYFAG